MKTGIKLISQERQEQIEKHGYSLEKDKTYVNGELVKAAHYCLNPLPENSLWPSDWRTPPKYKIFEKNRIGQLMCAGAFYMAENDRIGENKYQCEIDEIAWKIDNLLTEKWLQSKIDQLDTGE